MRVEIVEQKTWKESFTKSYRPEITDLERFMNPDIYCIFKKFAEYILQEFDLRFGIPVWTEKKGWIYRIGKSGVWLITGIRIEKNKFVLGHIEVVNEEQYRILIAYVEEVYQNNREDFYAKISDKNKRQRERTAKRVVREKRELEALQSKIVPDKYNMFRWPAKLDIHKLHILYMQDAKGIYDEALADEIGLTLYLRCKYGKEDMERIERYIVRCHGCQSELTGESDFRECSCGLQYSYKEYRRSYCRNNMPTGAAKKIFNLFIENWERAKTYQEKIVLIDTLLHEFHVSLVSGAIHRPVAMNFIDGSRRRVEQIINSLARNV